MKRLDSIQRLLPLGKCAKIPQRRLTTSLLVAFLIYRAMNAIPSALAGEKVDVVDETEVAELQEKFDGFGTPGSPPPSSAMGSTLSMGPSGVELINMSYSSVPTSPGGVASPTPSRWQKMWDKNQNAYYYYNTGNGTSQWEQPSDYIAVE